MKNCGDGVSDDRAEPMEKVDAKVKNRVSLHSRLIESQDQDRRGNEVERF